MGIKKVEPKCPVKARIGSSPLDQLSESSKMPVSGAPEHSRRRVAYYYDSNVGNYYYGQGHVMKPHRIRMTHHLLLNYGIYRFLEVYRPFPATFEDLCRFHSEDYMRFLQGATPDNLKQYSKQMLKFNVGEDCPVFDGLYEFCQLSSGKRKLFLGLFEN